MGTQLNGRYFSDFVSQEELAALAPQVCAVHNALHTGNAPGSDYLGWLNLPRDYDREEFRRIQAAADRIRKDSEVLVVIGIGGSYLGARAAIEFLHSNLYNSLGKSTPSIYYAGNSLSPAYLNEILSLCREKDFSVNVISKSGTTTEPALAFRFFRELLEEKYGPEGAARRIYCTTDRAKGTLKAFADKRGFETFVVPDDVGGRYSVLTAVGLLPIAVTGVDLEELMLGAREAMDALAEPDLFKNDCYRYAAVRNILHRKGKAVEIFVSHEPAFAMLGEWYKQLFGESEGKDHKGIFPASVTFSTDLHSMGQFIQEGTRNLFEIVLDLKHSEQDVVIPTDAEDIDGLNFLAGKEMSFVSRQAVMGTLLAHVEGGVPCAVLELPDRSPRTLGYLFYFFEKACAVSGGLLGVNAFNQPGVENYKRNMFALIGKPGYEELRKTLEEKLAR